MFDSQVYVKFPIFTKTQIFQLNISSQRDYLHSKRVQIISAVVVCKFDSHKRIKFFIFVLLSKIKLTKACLLDVNSYIEEAKIFDYDTSLLQGRRVLQQDQMNNRIGPTVKQIMHIIGSQLYLSTSLKQLTTWIFDAVRLHLLKSSMTPMMYPQRCPT